MHRLLSDGTCVHVQVVHQSTDIHFKHDNDDDNDDDDDDHDNDDDDDDDDNDDANYNNDDDDRFVPNVGSCWKNEKK